MTGRTPCEKCGGTGRYGWGAVVNGKPSHSGECFACEGKGHQTDADRRRNWSYWRYRIAGEAREMMRQREEEG